MIPTDRMVGITETESSQIYFALPPVQKDTKPQEKHAGTHKEALSTLIINVIRGAGIVQWLQHVKDPGHSARSAAGGR